MKPNPYSPPVHVGVSATPDGPAAPPSWIVAFRWIVAAGAFATGIGIVGRMVRPLIPGSIHYEAIVGLILLILLCIALLLRFWRFPLTRGVFCYGLGTVAVWAGNFLGWTIVHGSIWADLLQISLAYGAITAVIGGLVMFVPHRRGPTLSSRNR